VLPECLEGRGAGLISNARARTTTYTYNKLDVDEVGKIAHETYFMKFCADTVMTALFKPLAESVGEPYASFPVNSTFWAHGGMMGWGGTDCGTLIGAGMAVGLITGGSKEGEAIINDVISYYANKELSTYKPAVGQAKAAIHITSLTEIPICHIFVGKWMKKENVGFFTNERKERCA
jgi:hypothetical protein